MTEKNLKEDTGSSMNGATSATNTTSMRCAKMASFARTQPKSDAHHGSLRNARVNPEASTPPRQHEELASAGFSFVVGHDSIF